MPKVKVPRKNISLDMTAMCDVAFLLLTFFMLTTKFKPDEPVVVDMPASVSEIKLPDKDVLVISIGDNGQPFFSIDNRDVRISVLKKIAENYQIEFTDQEYQQFSKVQMFGVPIRELKAFIKNPKMEQKGIPADSSNNELKEWIKFSRKSNSNLIYAIKGDQQTDYNKVKQVIETFRDLNINKINLVTNLEEKPKS